MAGQELFGGRYELRGLLGHGGMAEVHAGWDVRLDRPVAIKILHRALLSDADSRARFAFEAKVVAGLNHPNIVTVHDSGELDDGVPYLVMERLPGTSLAQVIARGPMPVPAVRAVLSDLLAGLAAAHAAGVLHRDVKPANVLFGAAGEAKLADFGIAKSGSADITRVGQVVGTMAYLSAERITGAPAGPGDDLYAVGAVGYEMLAGRMAFPQPEPAALLQAITVGSVVPLRAARPDVDPVLFGVVERAMSPDAAVRFSTADAMRGALNAVRSPTLVLAAPTPMTGAVPLPPPPGRRRKTLMAIAVAVAIGLALLLVIVEAASSGPATTDPPPSSTTPSTTTPTTTTTTTTTPTSSAAIVTPVPPGPGERPGNGNERPRKPKRDG